MKNWVTKKLGDVCELSAGGDVPKGNFSEIKTDNHQIPIYANGEKNEGFYGYTSKAKVTKPSITVSGRGTIGYSVKRIEPFFPIVRLIVVTPINLEELCLNYLDYAIRKIDFKHSGSSIPQLTVPMIRDYEIPLPPLPEQQSIVATLDEAFTAIAKAKANAEQNLKNAKELFESYLQGVFEKKGEGWEEKTLGEIASFAQGIQVGLELHLTEPKPGYVRFIRIVDYTQNTDDIRYVPDPGEKYYVKEDDIVMVRYGTPGLIGRGKAGVIANNLFKITIETKELSKDFLCLCLSQKHIQTYLSTQGSATMPALNFGQLKTVSICYPSIKAQQSIVQKLDALSAETKKLEAIYQTKIKDLEELKKSVLQKAFSGELKTEKELV
jgi:type I restriction enzyme S subunit